MIERTITFAQNREDIFLAGFFKNIKNGFYVDVGANDPDIDSVTKYFYNQGWQGMNIEPIKRHFDDLCEKRSRDINLNIGISDKAGEITLREYEGSGLSTFSEDMQQQYIDRPSAPAKVYTDYKVPVKTLKDVFSEHKVKTIHFLKVDVEGYEYEVLTSNDWVKYRPQVICIEANHVKNDWHPMLRDNKYKLITSDGLNEYFIDTTLRPDLMFDYVTAVIDREPIVSYKLIPDFDAIKQTAVANEVKLKDRIGQLEEEVLHLERYTQNLLHQLDDIASLRKHTRKVVVKNLRKIDNSIITRLQKPSLFTPAVPPRMTGDIDELLQVANKVDKQTASRLVHQVESPTALKYYTMQKKALKKIVRKDKHA